MTRGVRSRSLSFLLLLTMCYDIGPAEVTYTTKAGVQWLDFLPSPVILLTLSYFGANGGGGSGFVGAACANGSIVVYTLTGRRHMPTLTLGEPCAYLESSKTFMM